MVLCDTDGGTIDGSTYELDLRDGGMSWVVCKGYPPQTTLHQGSSALTAEQLQRFNTAMGRLECVPRRFPIADDRERVVLLEVDGGVLRYEDEGYSYRTDTTYIRMLGVLGVLQVLDELAGVP